MTKEETKLLLMKVMPMIQKLMQQGEFDESDIKMMRGIGEILQKGGVKT